jgi:hypothetical protein
MRDRQFLGRTRHRAAAKIPSGLGATQHQHVETIGRLVPTGEVNG